MVGHMEHPYHVVGGGISGAACAATLAVGGAEVVLYERSAGLGGRISRVDLSAAGPDYQGRLCEWGAAYLTGYGDHVEPHVQRWLDKDLLQPWTDSFMVAGPRGFLGKSSGPMRYRARGSMRSIVRELVEQAPVDRLSVRTGSQASVSLGPHVDGEPARAVVLAMPPSQADAAVVTPGYRVSKPAMRAWRAVVVTVVVFPERTWPAFPAAFVNDSQDLALMVDDGHRVGDEAPVLVLYSLPEASPYPEPFAEDLLQRRSTSALARAGRILPLGEPMWMTNRAWRLAQPAVATDAAYRFDEATRIGRCGDGFAGRSRVGSALTSGLLLGQHLLALRNA